MSVSSVPSEVIAQLRESPNDNTRFDLICSFLSQSSSINIGSLDSKMESIICNCLKGENDPKTERLLAAFVIYKQNNSSSKMSNLRKTAKAVSKIAPIAYLNAACPNPYNSEGFGFGNPLLYKHYPLSKIPTKILVDWCSENEARWKKVIPYLEIFVLDQNNKEILSPLINDILKSAPRSGVVVNDIIQHINNINNINGFSRIAIHKFKILKQQLENHPCEEIQIAISNNIILKNAYV